MNRFVITFVAGTLLLGGCGKSGGGAPAPRTTAVTQQQALDAAKAAVEEHDSFGKTASYEAAPEGNGWIVTVVSGKQARVVMIDAEGKVATYEGGK